MRFFFFFSCWALYACTDFVVQAVDGTLVNGRSLEFGMDLQSSIKVVPRNQKMSSQNPNHKKGIEWVSKYGFVGVTALGMNFSFDGLNEAGLSFGYLWLPGFTEYPSVSQEEMKKGLDFVDFGAWALGNFSTVAEVKEGLKGVRIWGHAVPPLPGIPPVHAAIHDAQGNHLVVEFVEGQMKIYENPTSVLTNSPPFPWHLINLGNYVGLQAVNDDPIQINGLQIAPQGQGSGLIGIPGDWTPPSRFVKVATLMRFAQKPAEAMGAVNLAEHLLNTVDIPLGDIQEKGQKGGDFTQWAVIKDLTHKVFYFRSYYDLCLKRVDLKQLDFDKGTLGKSLSLNTKKGYSDMTAALNGKNSLSVRCDE